MQTVLGTAKRMETRILGVNSIGLESANATATAGRTIPWLQDVVAQRVWESWAVTYRDVVILGEGNSAVAVYNLTANDLGVPANFDSLKTLIENAAR